MAAVVATKRFPLPMRSALVIAARDVRSAFEGPVVYVLMAAFLIVTGLSFLDRLATFANLSDQARAMSAQDPSILEWISVDAAIIGPFLAMVVLLLHVLVPLLTMRLLAEENRSGTMELLLTAPVSPASLVAGKFLAGLTIVLVPIALSAWQPLTLWILAEPDMAVLASGLLGVVLAAAVFTAVGLLASSLTESPLLAAFLAFTGLALLGLCGMVGDGVGGPAGAFLRELSVLRHFSELQRGVVSTADLAILACLVLGALALTHRVVESRRWR